MRIGREDWTSLNPDDVAWVAEWQLAAGFPWVPRGEESPVHAAAAPDPAGGYWRVSIRTGLHEVDARLPVRDLGRVIRWCYGVSQAQLFAPPASVRASLLAIREALRAPLLRVDPLGSMGYLANSVSGRDSGG